MSKNISTLPSIIQMTSCRRYPKVPDIRVRDYCCYYPYFMRVQDEHILRMVHRNGPAVVLMNSRNRDFINFRGDEYTGPCTTRYDHAVLLVGWDEQNYILQNSWGSGWGQNGLFKLRRHVNKCGVQNLIANALL